MKRIFPICLIGFILYAGPASGQMQVSADPPEVIAVFESMYRYDLKDAGQKLKKLYATNIDPSLIELTQVNLLWWLMISGDESRDYDNMTTVILKRTISRLSLKPRSQMSREDIFTMIHSYAYLTRVDIYFNRYLRGIANLRRTLDYLQIALDNASRYDKYMLVAGLYHYFAKAAVIKYSFLAPFFSMAPPADRELGYRLLNQCAGMNHLLIRNESLYYLMKINYQLEEDFSRSLRIADQLLAAYPNNLIYHYHRFTILLEAGLKEQALEQYKRLVAVSASAPGLNAKQRTHLIDIAIRQLRRQRINPAI
ncbi:MAG: hypothetical protein V2A67_05735 [Bacteroidota bacterium]